MMGVQGIGSSKYLGSAQKLQVCLHGFRKLNFNDSLQGTSLHTMPPFTGFL